METLTRERLKKLAEETTDLYEWTVVRDFATQMYGEGRVASVKIETYEEYDDENYSYPLGNITAYDKGGVELPFDHSLPFFATRAWRAQARYDYDNDFEVFKEVSMKGDERRQWILCDDLPQSEGRECTVVFDLTTIPSITLPVA
jgi:hypothetical protein